MQKFEVDEAGLAKLLERRGKAWAAAELVQNALDEDGVTYCRVEIHAEGRGLARLRVEDDSPEGWKDLSHAWTLFAESYKKPNAEKRGRFNLGEKLVIAIAKEVTITTTSGTVVFDADGRRRLRGKTERGSIVTCLLPMTAAEILETNQLVRSIIAPAGIRLTLDGEEVAPPRLVGRFSESLLTEVADADGVLKRAKRKAEVLVYEPRLGEEAHVYEMGIPVVPTGDRWHYDVKQRVPLSLERDNVPPSLLAALRVGALNVGREELTKEDAKATWVEDASSRPEVNLEAVERVLDLRFGPKRAAFDPSDIPANKQLMNEGYTIVPGGALSGGQWENAKSGGLVFPAGQIRPSSPFGNGGRPEKLVAEKDWTDSMRWVAQYCTTLSANLGVPLNGFLISNEPMGGYRAWFGERTLALNLGTLGRAWFETSYRGDRNDLHALLIHELSHDAVSDHLTHAYHKECCQLGARMVAIALEKPELFEIEAKKSKPANGARKHA
jgi:hypothetical protein